MNDASENRILKSLKHINIKSATTEQIEARGLAAYCEDIALSLKFPGSTYKALSVHADTEVLSDEDRQNLFDVLCCFYDFSQNKPNSKGELGAA